ncbi:hypothetical protein [Paenibacillus ginsengarvi]|uniref:hypothetical protein n=1 Tax=Paenibacillus ginsengarvi TaxID=400777 RepID=UPI0011C49BFE|nr:hypothetical protein [Paenibacillus ginsengarvi]
MQLHTYSTYNCCRTPAGKPVDEEADSQLLVFDEKDETEGFKEKHGLTLEEWAALTFGNKAEVRE